MGDGGGEVVNLFLVYMQMDLSGYDNRSNSSNETSKDEYFWKVPQPDFLNPAQELLLKISRVYISTLHHQQLSCKSESISLVILVLMKHHIHINYK